MFISEYIDKNLLCRTMYGTCVADPTIEQLLMLKHLCDIEITKYFHEKQKEGLVPFSEKD